MVKEKKSGQPKISAGINDARSRLGAWETVDLIPKNLLPTPVKGKRVSVPKGSTPEKEGSCLVPTGLQQPGGGVDAPPDALLFFPPAFQDFTVPQYLVS